MIRGFILEIRLAERNAICPRLLLLVCFASISESRLQMKILPDDFISTSLMQTYSFPCVVQALEEGPMFPNRQQTEAFLTLSASEIPCGISCPFHKETTSQDSALEVPQQGISELAIQGLRTVGWEAG